jgi:hypothetical protein
MNRSAQVNSIDAIDQFRAAFGIFGDEVNQVLSAIRSDLQRFLSWLEHDQLGHWQREIRVRDERVAEAKNELHRCLSATIDPNRTPSCLQEKKLLAIAKQRLEEAERKLAAVRHWIVAVRQAVVDYHARAEPLASAAASDVPKAMAELQRTVSRLTSYIEVAPPSSGQTQAANPNSSAPAASAGAAIPAHDQPQDLAAAPEAATSPEDPHSPDDSTAEGGPAADDGPAADEQATGRKDVP